MGKELVNKIRGMNPLTGRGVLLFWAILLSFACTFGLTEANAAPTASNAWTNVYANTATTQSVNLTSTTTFTANAGTNRLLLVVVDLEIATTAGLVTLDATPTFGGVPLTTVNSTFGTSSRIHTWMGFLTDSSIPTGAQTVNFQATSGGGTFSGAQIKIGTYTGVDQSTPISASTNRYAAATSALFPAALSYTADSRTVVASANSTAAITPTYTSTGGGTIAIIAGGTSGTGGFSGNIGVSAVNAAAGSYTTGAGVNYAAGGTRTCLVAASLKAWVLSTDTTKPTVDTFVMPSSASTAVVSVTSFTASDNPGGTGVAGYLINESATAPAPATITSPTPPTTYTFATGGTKTLYAWVKDGAGNVSLSRSQTVLVTLPVPPTRAANWTSQYAAVAFPAGTVSNYAMTAGNNRVLVVAIASTRTAVGALTVSNVTWGGRALTLAAGTGSLATIWNHSFLYYLKEADIAAAIAANAGATTLPLNVTITGGTAYYTRVYAALYTGVDQTNPVPSAVNYESNQTTTTAVGPFNPTLTVNPYDKAVEIINLARSAVGTTGRTITTGWATGWTAAGQAPTGIVTSGPCQQVYIRDRLNSTVLVNDGSQHTASSATSYKSMTAMTLKPAADGVNLTTGATVANSSVFAGDINVAVDAFTLQSTAADNVTGIQITGSAASNNTNVSRLKIYRKVGSNGAIREGSDIEIANVTNPFAGGNVVNVTLSEAIIGAQNYIIVYDIAATAAPSTTNTLTASVTGITVTVPGNLSDPLASSGIITIYPTTTIGNGTEPPAQRIWKGSTGKMLDAFTLAHNSAQTTDDDIFTNVTVTLSPVGISGAGNELSKIAEVAIVNAADTVTYGSMTAATVGDTWNIPVSNLSATSTETPYFIRIKSAGSIVPGFYTVSGKITSVVRSKMTSKFVNNDTGSATLSIDVEPPVGPTTFTATTTSSSIQPGGKIDLSWNAATEPNLIPDGALHATTPYIVKRSVAGGTDPADYCTDGTTVPVGDVLSFRDSGLNATSAPIYHYRVCAMDTLGNTSIGVTASAASSYTDDCNNLPDVSLGVLDPVLEAQEPPVYAIQDQIVKSEGGQPFNLQVTNNDIGNCPNVNFNISLVDVSTTGGTCVKCDATDPPPSLSDFSVTYPATVLLGKTAGPGGTNRTSATVPISIHGLPSADQIQKYIFKAQVSEAVHGTVTSLLATAILNDMPPIVHNANNMGKYQYGIWGNTYTCATCHSNSTTNIKGVYQIISTHIGKKKVVFTKTSSTTNDYTGVYSNDQRTNKNGSDQVCSVCHHRTRQHQYSANKPYGGPNNDVPYDSNHHNSNDCAKCHTHNTAFRSIYGVCGDCHGFKGTQYAPINKATMVKQLTNALGTSPPSYGAHLRHNIAKMSCAVCHSNTNHGLDTITWIGDDKLEIGFKIDKNTFPGFNPLTSAIGGTFAGTNNLNSPYSWVSGPRTTINSVVDYNSSCSTYCHGGWANNVGSNIYPNWVGTGQAACGTCHNATTITPPVSGSHVKHSGTGSTGLGLDCIRCHGTYANYTGSAHINGNVQWDLTTADPVAGSNGKYNGAVAGATGNKAPSETVGTCTTLYCHSNVQGASGIGAPTLYATPQWGDNGAESTTAYCGSCHEYPNHVGGHEQHENAQFAFDCHVCHNSGGTTSPRNHANGKIDFNFAGLGVNTKYKGISSIAGIVTPGTGYGTCSTSDCHGRYTRTWGPPSEITLCDKCHGSRTSARGFYNTRGPDGTLSIYSAGIGLHDIHVRNQNSPRKSTFNRFTSFSAGFNCNQCHNTPNGPYSPGHMDNALPAELSFTHVSSIAEKGAAFGYISTAKYSGTSTQTCSSVWCHGAGMDSNRSKGAYVGVAPAITRTNPKWNTPILPGRTANQQCTSCHGLPPTPKDASSPHYNVTLTQCVGCHQHLTTDGLGFTNKSLHVNGRIDGGCTGCHGNPPVDTGIGTATGLATPAQNALLLGGAGAHQAHINNINIGNYCYTCHYNYNPVMKDVGENLEIGFNGFNGLVVRGTFTGYTNSVNGPKWKANSAPTGTTTITKVNGTTGQEANVCSNLYCHGGGTATLPVLGGGSLTTPNWETSGTDAACGTCHGADTSSVPQSALPGAHTRHAATSGGLELGCDTCHGTSSANMTHVNGNLTWDFDVNNPKIGNIARYKGVESGGTNALAPSLSYGSCNNFYCHSNVQGTNGVGTPTYYGTPAWGGTNPTGCAFCHMNMATDPTGTGSHKKHANTTTGMGLSCGYCHQDGGSGSLNHADGQIFVNFTSYVKQTSGAYSNNGRLAGSAAGYGTCSATFCHGTVSTAKWGDAGPLSCSTCHGANARNLSWSGRHITHYNNYTGPTSYTQTVTDLSATNKYTFNCAHCHDDNIAKHSLKPYSSSAYARVFFGISAAGTSGSRRGKYSYGAAQGATDNGFKFTAGSCNTSYCHSDGKRGLPLNTALNWTTAPTAGSNCLYCHDGKRTSMTATKLSGRHDKHMNYSTNQILGKGNGLNCIDCHARVVTNTTNLVIADKSKHVNAVVNYSSTHGGGSAQYIASTKSCTTYCHSNGNQGAVIFVSMTGQKAWGGSSTFLCSGCHGRGTANGSPNYASGAAGSVTANAHSGHVAATDTTTVCSDCHWRTASKSTANKFVDYTAGVTHLNGSPNVYFNKAKIGANSQFNTGTCSNVICHGNGTPAWGPITKPKCEGCHGYRKSPWNALDGATANTDHRAGAHFSHISTANYKYDTSYGCLECHSDSISLTTDSPNQASHFNNASSAKVNWTVGSPQAKLNGQSPIYNPTTKGCSTVYCHGSGMASNVSNPPSSRVVTPVWKTPFLSGTPSTVGDGATTPGTGNCSKCHGFPPMTSKHAGKAISSCTTCHSHLDATGLVFTDVSKHINGTVEASGGHVFPYTGFAHFTSAHTSPWSDCTGCHTNGNNTTYPAAVAGNAPDCTGCHKYGLKTPSGTGTSTKSCYDCHGSSATNAMPNGNVFPNWSGSHSKHVTGQGMVCADCHDSKGGGGIDPTHGSSNRVAHNSTYVNVTSASGSKFHFTYTGKGTCSNVACHGTAEWGVTKFNCIACHSVSINGRAAISGQFASQSHHVQGSELPLTNAHCAKCHWEAKSDGSTDPVYHSGTSGKGVSLIVWNGTTRPATPIMGTTYISYTANGSRSQIAKLNAHCSSCHNTPNQGIAPFGKYSTYRYSPEPRMSPALAKTSIQSRYSSSRTVAWSNYAFTNSSGNVVQYGTNQKKLVTKALSAHGNAIKNQFPLWNTAKGEDEFMADSAATTAASVNRNVFCYDCHNSHGSNATGVTSSYSSATGRYKGGLLKTTQAGKGGYSVDYTPAARTISYRNYSTTATTPALFNAGASICNDCHNNDTRKVNINKPWSITGTYSSTRAIVGYWSTPYFDNYTFNSVKRNAYKGGYVGTTVQTKDLRKPMGGHYGSSINGVGNSAGHSGEINGLCTPCHDPHGVSSSMTAVKRGQSVPLLKGTWVTSPYREDAATPVVKRGGGSNFTGVAAMGAMPGYNIDQNTLIALPAPVSAGGGVTTGKSNKRAQAFTAFPGAAGNALSRHTEKTPADFAGLCIGCHAQGTLTNATAPSASNWQSKERVHQSVAGWAATTGTNANGTVHAFTCSKCHAPHVSRLPRLMITNCLDVRHVKRSTAAPAGTIVTTPPATSPGFGFGNVLQSYASSAYGAGRFPAGGSRYSSTPGSAQNNGPWYFQTVQPATPTYGSNCHNATNAGGTAYDPTKQMWNKKTRW